MSSSTVDRARLPAACGHASSGAPIADAVIGVAVPKSVDLVVAFVAVLKAGGAYLALAPDLPPDRLRFMVQDLRAAPDHRHGADGRYFRRHTGALRLDRRALSRAGQGRAGIGPQPEDLAYVIYTSGTTGRPKGALIEHAALSNLAEAQRDLFAAAGRAGLLYVAMSFDVSIGAMATALAAGAEIHLVPQRLMAEPEALGATIRHHAIDLIELPATIARQLPQRADMAPRTLVIGGEVCPQDALSDWRGQCRVINAYGPRKPPCSQPPTRCMNRSANVIGRPIANVRIKLLDRAGRLCPIGVPGDI